MDNYVEVLKYLIELKKTKKEEIKTSTNTIKDITLEELTRFVIDHEPIVREENVKVKVEYR